MSEVKCCSDFYAAIGWESNPGYLSTHCCGSCHDDADLGYMDLIDCHPSEPGVVQICCRVSDQLDLLPEVTP